ncbi:MAG TPA: hypothetical protein VFV92_07415, partial [Candidatus Bathyarchaeia archaeon]|nr:hypothetical protein [Candidatus Bathyarchaeia archaeon]
MKAELDLSSVEVEAILRTAELHSERDYLYLELIGRIRGLRTGEVVGVDKVTSYWAWKDPTEHSKGREQRTSTTHLPGITAEDVKEGQVWIHRKGGAIRKIQLTSEFYDRLWAFARERPGQKLFDFRERRGYDIVQNYAREAGLADWKKVHP